jgi:hypothetical protein
MGYDNLIKQSGLDKTTRAAARRIRKINKPRQKEEPDRSARQAPHGVEKEPDKNSAVAPVGAPEEHGNGANVAPFPGHTLKTPSETLPDVLSYRDYPGEPLEIEGLSLEFMKKACFVPLSVSDTTFEIAMADPQDYDTIDALKFAFGLKVAVTKHSG